jgi:hypothetical protein
VDVRVVNELILLECVRWRVEREYVPVLDSEENAIQTFVRIVVPVLKLQEISRERKMNFLLLKFQ